jgi:hypothetical protein
MHVLRGFTVFSFYCNNSSTKLPLNFNKNKASCMGVFVVSIWLPDPSALDLAWFPDPCHLGLTCLPDQFFEVYFRQPIHLVAQPKRF